VVALVSPLGDGRGGPDANKQAFYVFDNAMAFKKSFLLCVAGFCHTGTISTVKTNTLTKNINKQSFLLLP
jgi:hypothetical protein